METRFLPFLIILIHWNNKFTKADWTESEKMYIEFFLLFNVSAHDRFALNARMDKYPPLNFPQSFVKDFIDLLDSVD